MIVTCVTIFVKEGCVESFIAATIENHQNSVREPGNLRFDLLQSKDDPQRFFLYEAYETEEAVRKHKETQHYLKWRDTVADWMARPREGIAHEVIRPLDKGQWV